VVTVRGVLANPLAGLDGGRCVAALDRGVRPPWPRRAREACDGAAFNDADGDTDDNDDDDDDDDKAAGDLLARCWALAPGDRPTAAEASETLGALAAHGRWA
jgi:hypothetical protein